MKGLIICAVLLFACLAGVSAAEDCNVGGHAFKIGEKYSPIGECIQITCEAQGGISSVTCPDVQSLKPCKYIPADLSKPYPSCCPKFEC